jgi:cell division protein FtsI (penicillin-binding protein 3)
MGEAMTATPLQLASAYAAIAADGVYHAPASRTGERIMSSKTAGEVMAMLETSVEDPSATGKLARVAGLHVAGKTGTADVDHHTYASFVGIADLPKRRVVILVGVETRREGASGGAVAAPAFARLVGKLR